MRRMVLQLYVAVAVLGCSTPEETVVGKPPEAGAVVEQPTADKSAPAAQPRFPPARLTLAIWPYIEANATFVLTWSGGNHPVPLQAAPDPNARQLGDVVWKNGERILWQDSVVGFYKPRVLRANQEWFVEGPVYTEGFLTDQEFVQLTVKKGQRVEVWAYGGDGLCYMAHDKDIFSGPCPPQDLFGGFGPGKVRAEWYMPEQKIWWVQIVGNNVSGWVPVDDRMTLDIVTP